ncbi:callose synthase 10 [Quercus suber]|uniref:Callose synthase 10 n=1 Tax=Quercus suber TaxID=58331 RepID=A0AAW0JB12_QUESU
MFPYFFYSKVCISHDEVFSGGKEKEFIKAGLFTRPRQIQSRTYTLDSNRATGHRRTPSGIAGAIPPSLERATNIDAILHAADEIQSENPNVARILNYMLG